MCVSRHAEGALQLKYNLSSLIPVEGSAMLLLRAQNLLTITVIGRVPGGHVLFVDDEACFFCPRISELSLAHVIEGGLVEYLTKCMKRLKKPYSL